MRKRPARDFSLLLEQHLERQALAVCRPASFLGVIRACGLLPTLAVPQANGTVLHLRASDLFAARTKWLANQELGEERTCLAERGRPLMAAFQTWLTTSYTPRYRSLSADAQRVWISQVVMLVVVRHLMEEKCRRLLTEGRPTFADPWAGNMMCYLRLQHELPGEVAHLIKQRETPELWPSLIQSFLIELDKRTWAHPVVEPTSLPPLPKGIALPFVLPPLRAQDGVSRSQNGGI